MNEQHRFWQRALRMLSMGVPREQLSSVGENDHRAFQQEVWVRTLLKELQKKRIDMNTRLENATFIVVDTETTGFSPQHGDEIFAMAAAKTINGTLKDFYFTLIRPDKEIPDHISQLTGVKAEDVQAAPRLKEEMNNFLSFIGDGIVIGYHIGHDLSFINHFLWTEYRTKWIARFLDMQQILEMIHRNAVFSTLDAALSYYHIPCEKRHTADGDVQAMVELWKRILEELKSQEIETLYDLYAALSIA
ncbi:exonuclease domain-containing protein [Thermaerobacillus caldiproteolyticus]|uniref:DNA polymerase-3 subunit epsilon n=1 Tax=Thermaerobacillus caldiproteolyticus TaxID=247480 RepID=A0A7V9Z717_9BACL|nr:exonuclease domain-containing protein [Anoxybacillus caldiproteolyticus]MBA2875208.1 DNA polymerase-3 subunit epsilon [Anoxybacillus caldiproteolyticus]